MRSDSRSQQMDLTFAQTPPTSLWQAFQADRPDSSWKCSIPKKMSLGKSWSAGRCCWDVSICRWWLSQAGRCAERCRSRKLMMEKKWVIHLIRGPCWYDHYLNQKCEHVVLGRRSWIFVGGLPNTRTLNSGLYLEIWSSIAMSDNFFCKNGLNPCETWTRHSSS